MGRLRIDSHAVERYQERWAPHLSHREAREELERIAEGARPERMRTLVGSEMWVANSSEKILLVVKRDAGERICVTVLPRTASCAPTNSSVDLQEFLEFQEEQEEDRRWFQQQRTQELTIRHRLCDVCKLGEAIRYSRKRRQRMCTDCYTTLYDKVGRSDLGKCPLIEVWEKSQTV